jgi:hypothetical protein
VHSLVYIASTESYTFDSVSPIIFSHRQQLSLVNPQFASDVVHLFPVITTRSFIEGDHLRRHSTSYNHVPSPSTLSSLSLGLKTEGIFPVFPRSVFYILPPHFRIFGKSEIRSESGMEVAGIRTEVETAFFPAVFSESRISSELFRI